MRSFMGSLILTVLVGSCDVQASKDECPTFVDFFPSQSSHLPTPRKMTKNNTVCDKTYGDMSCCTEETALKIADGENKFNQFLRRVIVQPSSLDACYDAFEHLACLFECSPKIINARSPKEVPLCKSTCDLFYKACKDVKTCTGEWGAAVNDEGYDCIDHMDNEQPYDETLDDIIKSPEDFCGKMGNSTFFNITNSNVDCYDVESGEYMARKEPETAYYIFAYFGMAVAAFILSLGLLYFVRYIMKRNRVMRGI